jgi:hypothetical protein
MRHSFLPLALALSVIACKKLPPSPPGSRDAVEATPKSLPASFVAFEALLFPIVREPESDRRSRSTCAVIEKLRIKSLAIQRSAPTGVDAAAWEAASSEMRGAFDGLGSTCTDDPPHDTPDLPTIHQTYLRLVALLPK